MKKERKVYFIIFLIEKIPIAWHSFIAKIFTSFLLFFNKKRKITAYKQLQIAFPHWDKKKINKTILISTKNIFLTILETLNKKKYQKKIKNWLQVENLSEIEKIKSNNIIFFSGHFANWELGYAALDKTNLSGIVLRNAKTPFATNLIKKYNGSQNWKDVFTKDATLLYKLLNALKHKQSLYILLDIDTNFDSVLCNFFGKKIRCPSSVAKLALKYKKPIVACLNHRLDNGNHVFQYKTVATPPYSKEYTVQNISQKCTKVLEKHIKKYPQQWAWIEPRWKKERWSGQQKIQFPHFF